MFELETAIEEWRREMMAGKVREPEVLDELECHLRDEVAEQTRRGVGVEEAFAGAMQRIGRAEILGKEFQKIGSFNRMLRQAMRGAFRFAGVPQQYIDTRMNDSSTNPEARWATYARTVVFAAPAIILSMLAAIYIMPRLSEIWTRSGISNVQDLGGFVGIYRFTFGFMFLVKDHLFFILLGMIIALGLLEWRSKLWNRLRRMTFGTGVFLLNLAALLSFFVMFLAATLAASVLAQHVK